MTPRATGQAASRRAPKEEASEALSDNSVRSNEASGVGQALADSFIDDADQPIVGYPKHARPILHEALWSGFRQIGAQPNIVCEIIDKSTMLQFVVQGLGISLVPAWVKNIAPSGVSFVPFEPCENQIDLYVAFRKLGNSDTVKRFVDIVRTTSV